MPPDSSQGSWNTICTCRRCARRLRSGRCATSTLPMRMAPEVGSIRRAEARCPYGHRRCKEHLQGGHRTIVNLDLAHSFDRVHHQRLLDRIGQRVADRRVIELVGLLRKTAVVIPSGTRIIGRGRNSARRSAVAASLQYRPRRASAPHLTDDSHVTANQLVKLAVLTKTANETPANATH